MWHNFLSIWLQSSGVFGRRLFFGRCLSKYHSCFCALVIIFYEQKVAKQEVIGGPYFWVLNIWTDWIQRCCVQCLLYDIHRSWKNVSVTDLFLNTAYIAFLRLLINRSHTPPKWGAVGELNFHLIPRWIRWSSIPFLIHAATYSANSHSSPTKFVSLSLMIVLGLPLCAKKSHNCIEITRQLSRNGPKPSTQTFVKAVEASNRSPGRLAITGAFVCALLFLQITHFILTDLKEFRITGIHIFCRKMLPTSLVPSCWFSLC